MLCIDYLTLKNYFSGIILKGRFPEIWKKANVVPVHKKEENNFIVNYGPISLLSISGKISERLIYSSLSNNSLRKKLFAPFQSSFPPKDSCIAQLAINITRNTNCT